MTAYYNENDPYAAEWLRNLIAAGLIADGVVDDRSITEVVPDDIKGFDQCHFFAGIGGWSAALRVASWPDDSPVWTGSCPCQPFSAAGKQAGHRDERHLWPVFCELIRACRPGIVFGEQVASSAVVGTVKGDRPASAGDAHVWFDGVSADLEAEGYSVGAAVLGAHSVGAPHIRQRLFWVADSLSLRRNSRWRHHAAWQPVTAGYSENDRLADCHGNEQRQRRDAGEETRARPEGLLLPRGCCGLGNSIVSRPQRHTGYGDGCEEQGRNASVPIGSTATSGGTGWLPNAEHATRSSEWIDNAGERENAGPTHGAVPGDDRGKYFWGDFRVVHCRDGQARRVGSATSVLAHGVSRGMVAIRTGQEAHTYNRITALKGLGNAIVPQVAAEFITAFMEIRSDHHQHGAGAAG